MIVVDDLRVVADACPEHERYYGTVAGGLDVFSLFFHFNNALMYIFGNLIFG